MSGPTVLINRSDAIGDTLLSLAMAQAIRSVEPQAHIIFLVSQKVQNMMDICLDVDDVWVLNRDHSRFSQWSYLKKKMRQKKPDIYFYAGGSHLPSFAAWRFGVGFRGGLLSRWPAFLFLNKGMRQKRSFVSMHEVEFNLQLLTSYWENISIDHQAYTPHFDLNETDKSKARETLQREMREQGINDAQSEELIKKPWLIIHPGMTGHTLNWPMESYAQLTFEIEKKYPGQYLMILSHTPSDQRFIDDFNKELAGFYGNKKTRPPLIFFNGIKDGLVNYMALLSQASCFIGPSTGTTHLANLLKVPTVGIYSPIKVQSALRWGPALRNDRTQVVVPDVVCGETYRCAGESCPYYECMEKIEVAKIYRQVMGLIEQQEDNSTKVGMEK